MKELRIVDKYMKCNTGKQKKKKKWWSLLRAEIVELERGDLKAPAHITIW